MKLKRKTDKTQTTYGDLKPGDVFVFGNRDEIICEKLNIGGYMAHNGLGEFFGESILPSLPVIILTPDEVEIVE